MRLILFCCILVIFVACKSNLAKHYIWFSGINESSKTHGDLKIESEKYTFKVLNPDTIQGFVFFTNQGKYEIIEDSLFFYPETICDSLISITTVQEKLDSIILVRVPGSNLTHLNSVGKLELTFDGINWITLPQSDIPEGFNLNRSQIKDKGRDFQLRFTERNWHFSRLIHKEPLYYNKSGYSDWLDAQKVLSTSSLVLQYDWSYSLCDDKAFVGWIEGKDFYINYNDSIIRMTEITNSEIIMAR